MKLIGYALLAYLALSSRVLADEVTTLLQERLNDCGISVPVTGHYGELTEAAVRRFQRRNGLDDDGIVGPSTRDALFACGRERSEPIIIERQVPVERAEPEREEFVPERDRSRGPRCIDQVIEARGPIGVKALGFAERAAITVWKSTVGEKFGNQYVEWENATDKIVDCDPACSKCTVRAECTVKARPCRD